MELRRIDVRFRDGHELLGAYWGYLNGGGLVISDEDFEIGDELVLRVSIRDRDASYQLQGRVVKRQPEGRRAVIAFHPGEPHDMLLSEALADTNQAAPRRFRRFELDEAIRVSGDGVSAHARLVNISQEGCCIELESPLGFPVDKRIALRHGDWNAEGTVVWARHRERGIILPATHALPIVTSFFGADA